MTRFQQGDAFDAGHARQANIDQRDVGDLVADRRQGVFHRAVRATTITVSTVDQHPKPLPDSLLSSMIAPFVVVGMPPEGSTGAVLRGSWVMWFQDQFRATQRSASTRRWSSPVQ